MLQVGYAISSNGWEQIGNNNSTGKSTSFGHDPKINHLYLLYSDYIHAGSHPVLREYNEITNQWNYINNESTGFVNYSTAYNRIGFDGETGDVYAAHANTQNNNLISVMRYHVESQFWQYVGESNFSNGPAGYVWFIVQNNKNPYVLFPDIKKGNSASMMCYNEENNSWQYVGESGFSHAPTQQDAFNFDPSTLQPYVIFINTANNNKASVMTYTSNKCGDYSSSWSYLGESGFSPALAAVTRIAIEPGTSKVYVAYGNGSNNGRVEVQKYDHSTNKWKVVGSNLSKGPVLDLSFMFDKVTHDLYVAFVDTFNNNFVTVKKYHEMDNIGTWVDMGTPEFTFMSTEVTAGWNYKTNSIRYAFPLSTGYVQAMKFENQSDSTGFTPEQY